MQFSNFWKLWFKLNNIFLLRQQWTQTPLKTSRIRLRLTSNCLKTMKKDMVPTLRMMVRLQRMPSLDVLMRRNGMKIKNEKVMICSNNLVICRKDIRWIHIWQTSFLKDQTESSITSIHLKHTLVNDQRRFIFWWKKTSIFQKVAISVPMPGSREAIIDRLWMIWKVEISNMKLKMKKQRHK